MRLRWLVAAAGLAAAAACGGGTSSTPAGPTGPRVTIQDYSFSPSPLTIKAGTTVTWTNSGPSTHTTTSDTIPATWNSPILGAPSGGGPYGGGTPAGTFQFTFNTPGTYNYHCSNHPPGSFPGFTGTITVTP